MVRIDADAHVDESDATWEYMDAAEQHLKPLTLTGPENTALSSGDSRVHRLWLLDGRVQLRRTRNDARSGTTGAVRELADVEGRVRHLDRLGIDVQVLYPTVLLGAVAARPEVEVALCRSYNRWIAQATERSRGRLRWVAVVPLLDMDEALRQLRWAKDHGACGVLKRGIEHGKVISDPCFFPLYEEAMRLDLPICIHVGPGDPRVAALSPFEGTSRFEKPFLSAFECLIVYGLPDRFPTLRVGFIETMASWLPYVIADLSDRNTFNRNSQPWSLQADLLRRSRIYVAVQTSEDLPYLLKFGTEDNLLVGTDYTPEDQSAVLGVFQHFEDMAGRGEIPRAVVPKMFEDNPRAFYGL